MFLRARLIQDEPLTAGGTVRTDDLPVNPLATIYLTIRAQVSAAFTLPSLQNLLDVIARLEITYKGQSIISASLADLAALHYYLRGYLPTPLRLSDQAANARIWITVPIHLGPRPRNRTACFPAVRRGELQMQITPAPTFTNITNVTLQVETEELLDGAPTSFLKATTIAKTPTATGDHDVDLPIGNPIRGILLYSTTVPTDGATTASIQQLRVLVDNVEHGYAMTNWETLRGDEIAYRNFPLAGLEPSVRTGAAAPAANELLEALQWPTAFMRRYAYLHYHSESDADYRLQTEGRSRVHLRINAGAADAIRVIPVEEIPVQQSPTT